MSDIDVLINQVITSAPSVGVLFLMVIRLLSIVDRLIDRIISISGDCQKSNDELKSG